MLKYCWLLPSKCALILSCWIWELPGLQSGALAATVFSTLNAYCPNVKIIVLSGRPEAGRPALAAGASSFVSKADPPERLLEALHHAKG